jgi:hypothetical protein
MRGSVVVNYIAAEIIFKRTRELSRTIQTVQPMWKAFLAVAFDTDRGDEAQKDSSLQFGEGDKCTKKRIRSQQRQIQFKIDCQRNKSDRRLMN